MAYNYNYNPQAATGIQPQAQPTPQQIPPQLLVNQQQNIQPLFPQPQGNVYNINSTLEVANVPVGAGISVALCMPENTMYIKTMQNGNPLFYPYKILPLNSAAEPEEQEKPTASQENQFEKFSAQLKTCYEKIESLEEQINKIMKKKESDWNI